MCYCVTLICFHYCISYLNLCISCIIFLNSHFMHCSYKFLRLVSQTLIHYSRACSSYGSNLQTSAYIWENVFALGISIFGLLLFLYLLGNLQVSTQSFSFHFFSFKNCFKCPRCTIERERENDISLICLVIC